VTRAGVEKKVAVLNNIVPSDADRAPVDAASSTGAFRAEPPTRQRISDHVFESLARAILKGDLKAGEPLTTQRDLAKQFNVSALVVRQAIHRLEDLGLVRVRQGSATIVLGPEESSDIRLIQLQLEVAEPGQGLATSALEMQMLFLQPMLILAERRISPEQVAELQRMVEGLGDKPSPEDGIKFRIRYFRLIAEATRNQMYQQQVRWWATMVRELEQRGSSMRAPMRRVNVEFFRQLTRALAAHSGAAQLHLEMIRPMLDWVDAQRAIPPDRRPPPKR
jgi:DNA-binding FadR family transcriptional regulator